MKASNVVLNVKTRLNAEYRVRTRDGSVVPIYEALKGGHVAYAVMILQHEYHKSTVAELIRQMNSVLDISISKEQLLADPRIICTMVTEREMLWKRLNLTDALTLKFLLMAMCLKSIPTGDKDIKMLNLRTNCISVLSQVCVVTESSGTLI